MKAARLRGGLLWAGAVVLMLAAASYQRQTGPTYPLRGNVEVGDASYRYELLRSQETIEQARIALPLPGEGASGALSYRRYPTSDAFTTVAMVVEEGDDGPELAAYLPVQPAAGKMEYYLEIETMTGAMRIPEETGEDANIILRYKDPVPAWLLIAHVVAMFFTVLIGMRTGLGAVFAPANIRTLTWVTLIGMTVGGLVLGPFVQKYAFGEYWTGFPWGYDLTDNKLLIMWLVWIVAAMALGAKSSAQGASGRIMVLVASLVMTIVYLIPHSMRGSELDFQAVDEGVPPAEAVGTGRN